MALGLSLAPRICCWNLLDASATGRLGITKRHFAALTNQHAIPITVEAVARLRSMIVSR
jgi:hypothetical protein